MLLPFPANPVLSQRVVRHTSKTLKAKTEGRDGRLIHERNLVPSPFPNHDLYHTSGSLVFVHRSMRCHSTVRY